MTLIASDARPSAFSWTHADGDILACEHLVGHSSDPSIFKKSQLVPVQDLKLLVRDYAVSGESASSSALR
jgi:hypothetical protein